MNKAKQILDAVDNRLQALLKTIAIDLHQLEARLVLRVKEMIKEIPPAVDGEPGAPGRDGVDGRDALDLEILPEIDLEKVHPRGTWARHKGGLWRSFENTQNGIQSWECIVAGIQDIELSMDDRLLTVKILSSDDTERLLEKYVPMVIDRGPYKSAKDYKPGDCVSYGGSMWICQEDNVKNAPGNPGWRLAVKKGRDGKAAPVKIEDQSDA